MSSGNRDASTTDADMAALMESTDVRLDDQQSKTWLVPGRPQAHLSRV